MKYIVFKLKGKDQIFIFPRDVDHDRMFEACEAIRFGDYDWRRELQGGELVSAGFVNGGACHGRSETLNIGSRGDVDTALLREALK